MPWMFSEDGRGDSGSMSDAYWLDETGELQCEKGARPRVGVAMRVGTSSSRSYSAQDYWSTTIITEIISDTKDEVVFKTGNSTYTWRADNSPGMSILRQGKNDG